MALIDESLNEWSINPRFKPPYHLENIKYGSQYSQEWKEAWEPVTWHLCDENGFNAMRHPQGCMFTTKEIAEKVLEAFNGA